MSSKKYVLPKKIKNTSKKIKMSFTYRKPSFDEEKYFFGKNYFLLRLRKLLLCRKNRPYRFFKLVLQVV